MVATVTAVLVGALALTMSEPRGQTRRPGTAGSAENGREARLSGIWQANNGAVGSCHPYRAPDGGSQPGVS